MKLSRVQKLVLYALGEFYASLNHPLLEKNLHLRTSKITFIELLLSSKIIAKQERAVYKNLEDLEKSKMIEYNHRMIKFTDKGLGELKKIEQEIKKFSEITSHFQKEKPKRALQTTIDNEIISKI